MNKSQKDYTANRIRDEIGKRIIICSCAAPSLREHLRKAAVDGELQMLPSASIKETAKQITVKTSAGGYDVDNVNFSKLFREPKSYTAAMTAHLAEKEMLKEANSKREAYAERIIDQIYLDKFEDGETAIAQVISKYPN